MMMGENQPDSHLSVERLSRKIGRAKPEEVELAITGLNQIVAP